MQVAGDPQALLLCRHVLDLGFCPRQLVLRAGEKSHAGYDHRCKQGTSADPPLESVHFEGAHVLRKRRHHGDESHGGRDRQAPGQEDQHRHHEVRGEDEPAPTAAAQDEEETGGGTHAAEGGEAEDTRATEGATRHEQDVGGREHRDERQPDDSQRDRLVLPEAGDGLGEIDEPHAGEEPPAPCEIAPVGVASVLRRT